MSQAVSDTLLNWKRERNLALPDQMHDRALWDVLTAAPYRQIPADVVQYRVAHTCSRTVLSTTQYRYDIKLLVAANGHYYAISGSAEYMHVPDGEPSFIGVSSYFSWALSSISDEALRGITERRCSAILRSIVNDPEARQDFEWFRGQLAANDIRRVIEQPLWQLPRPASLPIQRPISSNTSARMRTRVTNPDTSSFAAIIQDRVAQERESRMSVPWRINRTRTVRGRGEFTAISGGAYYILRATGRLAPDFNVRSTASEFPVGSFIALDIPRFTEIETYNTDAYYHIMDTVLGLPDSIIPDYADIALPSDDVSPTPYYARYVANGYAAEAPAIRMSLFSTLLVRTPASYITVVKAQSHRTRRYTVYTYSVSDDSIIEVDRRGTP